MSNPGPLRPHARRCEAARGAVAPLLALTMLLLALPAAAPAVSEDLERSLMRSLARAQAGATPIRFRSDGCSGGISVLWAFVAEQAPPFAKHLGERPPWEHCCVAHDWLYWRGRAERGYEARATADRALRQCVVRSGSELDPLLRAMVPGDPDRFFSRVADLMHGAVRAGGLPCTGLPWRWGYGWPQCTGR